MVRLVAQHLRHDKGRGQAFGGHYDRRCPPKIMDGGVDYARGRIDLLCMKVCEQPDIVPAHRMADQVIGPAILVASSPAFRSLTIWIASLGAGPSSLALSPGRTNAQARVVPATSDWTRDQA